MSPDGGASARFSTKAALSTSAVTLRPSHHGRLWNALRPTWTSFSKSRGTSMTSHGQANSEAPQRGRGVASEQVGGCPGLCCARACRLGGPESVSALRAWLSEGGAHWTVRREAVKALGQCVGEDDVGWALDFYVDNRAQASGYGRSSLGCRDFGTRLPAPASRTVSSLRCSSAARMPRVSSRRCAETIPSSRATFGSRSQLEGLERT